jgi:hypothetical protein
VTLLADATAFTVRDLSVAGVELEQEQWELLDSSQRQPRQALTVGFIQNPFQTSLPEVATAVDEEQNETKWFAPAIVDLRPEWWEQASQLVSDSWLRYPTAPGKAIHFDRWMGDPSYGDIEPWRLWMLWPIERWDVDAVLEAYRDLERNYILPVQLWTDAARGDVDPCQAYATDSGVRIDQHDHSGSSDDVWLCNDGENWLDEGWDINCRLDTDGTPQLKALPEPDLPTDLLATWRQLVSSSQLASWRIFHAVPEWDRQKVFRTERYYSQWLS